MKRLLPSVLSALLLAAATGAAAQIRPIPAEAQRGTLRHVQAMLVELDGKQAQLSPGAQIRDPSNRLVLPTALTTATVVRYLPDATGQLHRVWILSDAEAAASTPPPKPEPKPAEKPAPKPSVSTSKPPAAPLEAVK